MQQHPSSSGPPLPPHTHHQSMLGSHAMPQPPMHMQWQQGIAAPLWPPGMVSVLVLLHACHSCVAMPLHDAVAGVLMCARLQAQQDCTELKGQAAQS